MTPTLAVDNGQQMSAVLSNELVPLLVPSPVLGLRQMLDDRDILECSQRGSQLVNANGTTRDNHLRLILVEDPLNVVSSPVVIQHVVGLGKQPATDNRQSHDPLPSVSLSDHRLHLVCHSS